MPGLKLQLSAHWPYYTFDRQIRERILNQKPDSFIYLLPVNRAVRYYKKKLLHIEGGPQALIDPSVFTFQALMQHMYQQTNGSKKVVSSTMRLVLVGRAISDSVSDFAFFEKGQAGRGLIRKIDRMLGEFCEFGFSPSRFEKLATEADHKLDDFSKILQQLWSQYGSDLIDDHLLPNEVLAELNEQHFRSVFPNVETVFINGYGIFTPPMVQFIAHCKVFCNVHVALDFDPANPALFEHTNAAFEMLKELDADIEISETGGELHRTLFALNAQKTLPDLQQRIVVQKCRDRRAETQWMAAEIRRLHVEKSIPLHHIGITFPNLETYAGELRSAFTEAGVPYNLSTGFSLSQSPLIQGFLQTIRVVLSGYDVSNIAQLMSSPFLPDEWRAAPGIIRRLSVDFRMRRFSGSWAERFEKLADKIKEKDPRQSENILKIKSAVESLKAILEELSGSHSVTEFKQLYLQVLEQTGMLNWFQNDNNVLHFRQKEREFRAFNRFVKVLEEMHWILHYMHGDEALTLRDWFDQLQLAVDQATYNLREWSRYGVQIMPRLEIQSIECRVLFVGGLIENDFPRRFSHDIFFDDTERARLGLNASEDLLGQDRFLFYQLLQSPEQTCYLSYPAFSSDVSYLPSTFISGLKETALVRELEPPDEQFLDNAVSFPVRFARSFIEPIRDEEWKHFEQWRTTQAPILLDFWLDTVQSLTRRKRHDLLGEHEGRLEADSRITGLLSKRYEKHLYSVTQLETYAFCPMQFFLGKVIGLGEEDELEETISAMERGTMVHEILFRFYRTLRERKWHHQPWEHLSLLRKIAEEILATMPYDGLMWELEKENLLGSAMRPGVLQKILEVENRQINESKMLPHLFEFSFGGSGRKAGSDKFSSREPLIIEKDEKTVRLTGIIDRVDVDVNDRILIIDYKTGSGKNLPGAKKIYAGRSLQLPIYAEAMRRYYPYGRPVGACYFVLKDPEECARKYVIVDQPDFPIKLSRNPGALPSTALAEDKQPVDWEQLIRRSLDFAVDYAQAIKQGQFEHTSTPNDNACQSYCEFKTVCRKNVHKLLARQGQTTESNQ